jgi:DnaK suppressor protein
MNTEDIRDHLTRRLAELKARIRGIEAELQEPLDDDSAEQAVDREDDEPLDTIERSALEEIARIDDALARLAAGSYGTCLSCGAEIDPRRLRAMPTAALCITCATAGTAGSTP